MNHNQHNNASSAPDEPGYMIAVPLSDVMGGKHLLGEDQTFISSVSQRTIAEFDELLTSRGARLHEKQLVGMFAHLAAFMSLFPKAFPLKQDQHRSYGAFGVIKRVIAGTHESVEGEEILEALHGIIEEEAWAEEA